MENKALPGETTNFSISSSELVHLWFYWMCFTSVLFHWTGFSDQNLGPVTGLSCHFPTLGVPRPHSPLSFGVGPFFLGTTCGDNPAALPESGFLEHRTRVLTRLPVTSLVQCTIGLSLGAAPALALAHYPAGPWAQRSPHHSHTTKANCS